MNLRALGPRGVSAVVLFGMLSCLAPAAEQPPYVITSIASQTGPAAFAGQSQMKTLQLLTDLVNRTGGIRGRPLKIVFEDDQTSPQLALQLMARLTQEGAPVILGPTVTPTCSSAATQVVEHGPVMWCMSPAIAPPAGSYVFSAGPSIDAAGIGLIRYMRERGWKRLGVLASTDGSGQAFDRAVSVAMGLPENRDVQIVVHESMNPSDLSVGAQIARIKAANPQALITLATGTPWGTMMHGVNDAGLDIPIGAAHGNAVYSQLLQYRSFLPRELYFPGLASVVPHSVGPGPIQDAQRTLFRAFGEAGVKLDIPLANVWDPGMIVVTALRAIGPTATAQELRDYILKLHGWAGTSGIYDFSDGKQRGLTERAIVIDRWDKTTNAFIPVSGLGGYLRTNTLR